MATTKTYLVTNTIETRFPIEFVSSKNRKWIVLQHCRCVYKNLFNNTYLTGDIRVHCDFIERNRYLDSFACFSNTQLTKYKKREVISPKQTFKIWFTDMNGDPIKIKTRAEEEVEACKRQGQALYEEEMKNKYGDNTETETTETSSSDSEVEEVEAETTESPVETPVETAYISAFTLELMLIY
jgi:hypothetical protein